MPLTDVAIKKAKPGSKLVKLSDGGGLQLWIETDGAKRWRLAYRFAGKQKLLAIGVYPRVSLKEARAAREEARRLLENGVDPGAAKVSRKAARNLQDIVGGCTFDVVAEELIQMKRSEGKALATISKLEWFMSLARPMIGSRPIAEIKATEVLAVLKPIEARGKKETAKKMRGAIGQVFRYAIAHGKAENDPTSSLKGALAAPIVKPRSAITNPVAFGALLRAIDGYIGAPETKVALELLALTFVRPGELRAMEWVEVNLDAGLWVIPASKMKMRRDHRVPLAPRAVKILHELQFLIGKGKFVFPSMRTSLRCMSENTINAALRRLGFTSDEMTGHGFRATASSMLNECGLWNADAIERQLAHVDNDNVRRAYHRAEYWDERVKMMNYWADRCDAMRRGGEIIPLKKSGV